MKPILLLDVDGVLNPFTMSHNKRSKSGFVMHEVKVMREGSLNGVTYEVLLNTAHGKVLRRLEETFDIVWATSWNEKANELLAPLLGLPLYPVLRLEDDLVWKDRSLCWKTDTVAKAFSEGGEFAGRNFVWWDDDTSRRDRKFFNGLFGEDFHKLVLVNPGQGFTDEQVAASLSWANSLKDKENL